MSLEFHSRKTLLWGGNGAGKSAILKSTFRAFDAEPHGELPSWDYNAIVAVDFSVGDRDLTTVRKGDLRALYEDDRLLGVATSSLQWNEIFSTAVGFELKLLDRAGKYRHAAPSNFFLPFFINQDGSFGAGWDTFDSIKQFQSSAEHTLEFFAGVRPVRYFELRAEEQLEKNRSAEAKIEIGTLQRARARLRRNTRVSPVKLSAREFHSEVRELTARAVELAEKQEKLRKSIVEDHELTDSLSTQVRLSNAALREHAADFRFAAETSASDRKFVCPTCNAEHDDSFHTFLGLAEDARELSTLKIFLEKRLDVVQSRLGRNRKKAAELRDKYRAVQDLLGVKRGKFTFEDFIKSYSSDVADSQLATEENSLIRELEEISARILQIKADLKVVESTHDSKGPVDSFRDNFRQSIVELDVEQLDGVDKWRLAKRPYSSGSRYARSIIAYYSALWRTIAEKGDLPAPIVIDSPNQGAQDKEHLLSLLATIAATAPKNAQVILAHEENPGVFDADKIVELSRETRVLNSQDFEDISPELFSYVERARAFVIQMSGDGGEDEAINNLAAGDE
ncbi:hypothetical protein [Paraburkholderia bannensis]|uniref:hypothetical protein n=1 Tax=Paraburkholderia bannensis TaxID=765414 RepID=UPI0012EC094F|nr:hypothetical protein [Paraburkholderia bannensis]